MNIATTLLRDKTKPSACAAKLSVLIFAMKLKTKNLEVYYFISYCIVIAAVSTFLNILPLL